MKSKLLSSIFLVGLCLSTVSVKASDTDEYFYDEGEQVPSDLKFQPTPEPTTTTTTTSTTTTVITSTKTTPNPTTTTKNPTTTVETNEVVKPAVEDNFDQSLNPKNIQVIKQSAKDAEPDLVYDVDGDYENENVYDEGSADENSENKDQNTSTSEPVNNVVDEDNSEDSNIKEEEANENLNSQSSSDVDSDLHLFAKSARVKDVDSVQNEKTFMGLNLVYVVVPVASIVLVVLISGIILALAKKTNVFRKKSTTAEARKQIYKSVSQQDPVV